MEDRFHGYNASVGYTANFFPEMAPHWLELCIQVQGLKSQRAGRSYRYLDLGSGQGFHLCLLAAANAEAEFVGIDFQEDHVAHARELAAAGGLKNINFVQADFLDLASDWQEELGTFDYIALQGILSWVSTDLRAAVFRCVASASAPGSIAVFGYNTQPGWLSAVPFQHIANEFGKKTDAGAALGNAMTMFNRLKELKAPLLEQLPQFRGHLEVMATKPLSYLAHEYLTDNWIALWHSSVARDLKSQGLSYIGTSAIAEALLPYSLPGELRDIILEQPDSDLRQDVQDIVINQSFRRDIFCRDPRTADAEPVASEAGHLHLLLPPPPGMPVRFATKFGELTIEYAGVADILAAVADGPKSFTELMELKNPARPDTRSILLSMVHAHMLTPGKAVRGPSQDAQRFNAAVARAAASGTLYEHVAAANLGAGVAVSELELLFLDAWLSGGSDVDQPKLVQGVASRLRKLGRQLNFRGSVVPDEQMDAQVAQLGPMFVDQLLPEWRRLGVLE